jgi:hypothetical protein
MNSQTRSFNEGGGTAVFEGTASTQKRGLSKTQYVRESSVSVHMTGEYRLRLI